MKLGAWLKKNHCSQEEFVRRSGLPQSSISRYVNDGRIPSYKVMKAIMKATHGQVRPDDFYADGPREAAE